MMAAISLLVASVVFAVLLPFTLQNKELKVLLSYLAVGTKIISLRALLSRSTALEPTSIFLLLMLPISQRCYTPSNKQEFPLRESFKARWF